MKTKIIFCGLVCLISCELALAGDCVLFSPWAAYGGGCYYSAYSQGSVPYFALHPPVYYSYPIARTYGDSPFPYPPGMTAFQAYSMPPQPQIIKNEYVEEENTTTEQYQTHMPLRITNPFVEQSENTNMSNGARWEARKTSKPLVVYPASLARHTK